MPPPTPKLSLLGAVLGAIAAASCCAGPLLLAVFGLGGAGAFAVLSAWRPYLLALTAACLGAGFYFTYRRPRAAAGDDCGCEKPKLGSAGKIGLWLATMVVVLFVALPTVLGYALPRSPVPVAAGVKVEQADVHVEGMDCEACAVHLRRVLSKVGGFHDLHLDLATKTVSVTYEPAPGRLDAYVQAINELGYEASLPQKVKTAP